MGRMAVAPTLMLCLALLGCVSEKRNPVEGSWQILSGSQKTADTAFSYSQENIFAIKMFSGNHVGWFGRYLRGGDTLIYFGGGTFTLEGNNYTESVRYHSIPSAVGKAVPFEVEIRNDTLIQKGPRKTGEYVDSKWDLYEVWVRVE